MTFRVEKLGDLQPFIPKQLLLRRAYSARHDTITTTIFGCKEPHLTVQ